MDDKSRSWNWTYPSHPLALTLRNLSWRNCSELTQYWNFNDNGSWDRWWIWFCNAFWVIQLDIGQEWTPKDLWLVRIQISLFLQENYTISYPLIQPIINGQEIINSPFKCINTFLVMHAFVAWFSKIYFFSFFLH